LLIIFLTKTKIKMEKVNIRELRKEKKLTQMKLAELTGLSFVTINRAEKKGVMRLSTYDKIVDTLKAIQ
jgi:transcriptional regulator with XRE-family HTH domain